jgi:hypothetical protein
MMNECRYNRGLFTNLLYYTETNIASKPKTLKRNGFAYVYIQFSQEPKWGPIKKETFISQVELEPA